MYRKQLGDVLTYAMTKKPKQFVPFADILRNTDIDVKNKKELLKSLRDWAVNVDTTKGGIIVDLKVACICVFV